MNSSIVLNTDRQCKDIVIVAERNVKNQPLSFPSSTQQSGRWIQAYHLKEAAFLLLLPGLDDLAFIFLTLNLERSPELTASPDLA